MDQVLAIRSFVPAQDLGVSQRFYQALGFTLTQADEQVVLLKWGSFSFILQNFHVAAAASDCLMQMLVRDLDRWWRDVDPARVAGEFGVKPPTPPAMQPWGLKVGFLSDPSGTIWHIAEVPF